jgi:Flp pilus assembly protein TadB
VGRKRNEEGRTGGRGHPRALPALEAEQKLRAGKRKRLWWKWLVLVAILGLCAVMVVLAIEGAELLMSGCGAAAMLLGLVLIVFG